MNAPHSAKAKNQTEQIPSRHETVTQVIRAR